MVLSHSTDTGVLGDQLDSATGGHRDANQQLHVWRVYNSLIHQAIGNNRQLDKSHSLPIINAPAHEWATLITVLENLHKLNQITCKHTPGTLMVTFDMDLYKRALKLEYLDHVIEESFGITCHI